MSGVIYVSTGRGIYLSAIAGCVGDINNVSCDLIKTFTTFGTMVHHFAATFDSHNPNQYYAFMLTEHVTNPVTFIDWTDYHITVPHSVPSFSIFIASVLRSGPFTEYVIPCDGSCVDFSSGVHAIGGMGTYQLEFQYKFTGTGWNSGDVAEFTIGQRPTVPEPSAIALMGLGLLGLGATRRKAGVITNFMEQVRKLSEQASVEIYYGMADSTGTYENGVWLIKNGTTSFLQLDKSTPP